MSCIFFCSKDEETQAPTNTVQTTTPEPLATTQYTLEVTAGEGGTVSTEGGTFDEGTEVTVTAIPAEGYEFIGWEGNDSTNESSTQKSLSLEMLKVKKKRKELKMLYQHLLHQ